MNVSRLIRGLYSAIVLTASFNAAAVTITVTTKADQDGTDTANCSLREAVKAINTSVAYGGCPAGINRAENRIQLKSGIYELNKELLIKQETIIAGANTYRTVDDKFGTSEPDPMTGSDTSRLRPLTTIRPAAGKSIRLINASSSSSGLELVDLILEGGRPSDPLSSNNYGGAILSSGSVSLENVRIISSNAVRGGAIFLSGVASLSIIDSTLSGNVASQMGGAIDMSCYLDGNISRTLNINRSTLSGNSSGAGAGAIAMCGNVVATITASTLSGNVANASAGTLHYADDFGADDASITLGFVTAAENMGRAVVVSSGHKTVLVKNSVFAQNSAACYVNAASNCTVNDLGADNDVANKVIVLADMSEFEDDGLAAYGGLTDGYLPLLTGSSILDKVTDGCSGTDQRNLSRDNVARCDIGALERLQLAVVDDEGRNWAGDGRVAFVDVLANDSYGEDGSSTPVIIKPLNFQIVDRSGTELSDDDCMIEPADPAPDSEHPLPRLKVDTNRAVTTQTAPIKCYYQLLDGMGTPIGNVADAAQVEVYISNLNPIANNDYYMRPVGVTTVQLDLLLNDKDEDAIAGVPDATHFIIMIKGGTISDRAGVKTPLGFVSGELVTCPTAAGTGGGGEGIVCFKGGPLLYSADNNLSPFTEEFGYSIYDQHLGEEPLESRTATVTIRTDAPDPESSKGGSLDWMLLGLGMLAFLRRSRSV